MSLMFRAKDLRISIATQHEQPLKVIDSEVALAIYETETPRPLDQTWLQFATEARGMTDPD